MRALTLRRLVRRAAPAVVMMVIASTSAIASADGPNAPTDEQRSAARLLGTDGVKAALAGDCATAVDKLTRAEALVHAPTTAVPLGDCQIKLGKIVAGTEILNHVVHETLPPNAPQSWIEAKKRAQPILDAAEPRIARLRIHVERPAGAAGDPEITIDGEPMSAVLLDNIRPTDPGRHHIEAKQTGFITTATDVTLSEGESKNVSLQLEAAPGASTPTTTTTTTTPTTTTATDGATNKPTTPPPWHDRTTPSAPNRTPAFIVLGVGGAGLVVGSIFGFLALGNKSNLDAACASKVCPASSQSDIDNMHTNAIVSTVGFAVGALGIGIGSYLLFTAKPSDTPTTTSRGLTVQPWLGLGAAGLHGSFQ